MTKIKQIIRLQNESLESSLRQQDAYRSTLRDCMAWDDFRRSDKCEGKSFNYSDVWFHPRYCNKCYERMLTEVRRYPIRRDKKTNKMIYDYSNMPLRWACLIPSPHYSRKTLDLGYKTTKEQWHAEWVDKARKTMKGENDD